MTLTKAERRALDKAQATLRKIWSDLVKMEYVTDEFERDLEKMRKRLG